MNKGTPLMYGFNLNAALPLDYRSVVDTIEELLILSDETNPLVCHGQTTYVKETQLFYQYTGNGETGGWEEVCSLEKLKDVINITKEEITVNMENLEEGLRSKINVTAKELESKFSDLSGGDFSSITQDINSIRSEVSALEGKLNSKITQTADTIMLELTNREDGLKSQITTTAKELRSEFASIAGGDYSVIYQDLEGLHAEIEDMNGTLNNKIDMTAQSLKADMKDLETSLKSEIDLTAKNLESKFSQIAGGDYSSIYQDINTIRTEISAMDGKLTSQIEQTASTLRTEMSDMEAEIDSKIELSAKNLESKFAEIAGGDYSSIYQDIEKIRTEITDVDEKLTSSIAQTASSIRAEVTDFKSSTESKFTMLSDKIDSSVSDLDGKYTSLKQTVDNFKIEAGDGEALNSKIEQTAADIRTEVSNLETNLKSQISQTESSLTLKFNEGYNQGITKINKDGIIVTHSGMSGSTTMASDGFYVNNGVENVISITSSESSFKGKVVMTSGTVSGTSVIDGGCIATDSIDATKIKSNSITADQIAAGTITSNQIAAGAITSTELASNSITAQKIQSGSVTADSIAANAITSEKIAADAINGKTITGGSITGTTINNGNGTFSVDASGNLTAKSAAISGDITGSTFTSNDNGFKVLNDGTVKISSLTVDDLITTDSLNVTTINNSEYPKAMHRATTVYINSSAASDTSWYHGATYSSISEMLAYAPRNLNGYTLSITLNSNINENVALSWFHSGQVNLNFNGYTVNGYIYCYGASMVYRLYGGVSDDSKVGKVMPYKGSSEGSYCYAIEFQYCQFAINGIQVYPDKVNGNMSSGMLAHRGATGCVFKLDGMGDLRYLIRAEHAARIYVRQTSGTTNNATFCTNMGGLIQISSEYEQAGRSNTDGNAYWSGGGGMIVCNQNLGMDKITFKNTANSGSNTNTNTTETITVTKTVTASSGNTYRSTVYNTWKNDGTVRQGDYGYGDCQGCWFFGNNLYNTMNAGTVTKVVIRIKRQEGGVYAAQTMTVKSHNHTSKPSGAPTYTNTIGTCSCAVGSYIDLIITDTATINKLKACKGLGLSIGSTSSPYIVCSGNCQVIITYKTTVSKDS